MKENLALIAIIFIGFLFRFYLLGEVPSGLTSDEVNTGYDAYSVLLTGKDQWGSNFPHLSFKGFGDYRSPLYTYLAIPFISLFGLTALAVKLPSAIAGTLSIFLLYKVVQRLLTTKIALISAFLISVAPWAIGLSRQGVESNVAVTIFLGALWMYLKGKERGMFFYISVLLFILTLYTYTTFILFTPLAIFGIIFFDWKFVKKNKKRFLIGGVFFMFFLFPLLLQNTTGAKRFSQVGFINDITSVGLITELNQKIGSCNESLPNFFCRLIFNKATLFVPVFFQNYLHHFSFDFLYIKGTTTQYSILPMRGLLYLFEAVFLIAGLFALAIMKKFPKLIPVLLLLSAVPDSLSGGGHHSRAAVMIPFLLIMEGAGVWVIFGNVKRLNRKIYITIMLSGIVIITFSVVSFAITYFTHFDKQYSTYSNSAYINTAKDWTKEKRPVYVSRYLNDSPHYIFYLFYNKYPPEEFHKSKFMYTVQSNGFIAADSFLNMNYTNIKFDELTPENLDEFEKNAVFYAHPDAFPKDVEPENMFEDESGGAVFLKVSYNELVKKLSE